MIEFLVGNRIDYAGFALAGSGIWLVPGLKLYRQGTERTLLYCGCGLTLAVLLTGGLVVLAHESAATASTPTLVALRWATLLTLIGLLGSGTWMIGMLGQLRLQNRQAEAEQRRSAEARSRFLRRVRHEVRAPLNGVFGVTHLLRETTLAPRQHEYVEMIENSARWLETIIDDVLDYSHSSSNTTHVVESDFVLQDLLRDVLERFTEQVEQKEIHLTCSTSRDVPAHLRGNPEFLRQILVQLVGNAVRLTDQGHVRVNVSLDDSTDAGEHMLHFAVEDTGPGIAKHQLEAIFDESPRHGQEEPYNPGPGLGLPLCRNLVTRMGGRIWAISLPGQGTTFHFSLILKEAQAQLSDTDAGPLSGRSVLLLDADPVSRTILQSVLRSRGLRTRLALQGAEIERLLSAAADTGHPFDFLVLDEAALEPSELDRILEHVRNGAFGRPRSLLLVPGRATAPAAAVDVCVPRDQLPGALLQAFLRETVDTAPEQTGTFETAPMEHQCAVPSAGILRILLAEDNSLNQVHARALLEKRGHHVTVVPDGHRAVTEAVSGQYDLILMDVQMPRLDGLTAARQIRAYEQQHDASRQIPIIALTACALPGDRRRCLQAGMDGYLVKPIRPDELFALVDILACPARSTTSVPHTDTLETPAAWSCPLTPGPVDRDTIRRRTAHDDERLISIGGIFLPDSESMLHDLRSAAARGDFPMVRRTAHALKEALGDFGAPDAVAAAEAIEKMGAAGALCDFPATYVRLREYVEQIRQQIRRRHQTRRSPSSPP